MTDTRKYCQTLLSKAVSESSHPDPPEEGLFQPTSVIALLRFSSQADLLFIQKADTKGYPWRNQMAFPGGHHEPGDVTRLNTALRELEEELNISRKHVTVIGSLGHFQTINNKDIKTFVGVWNPVKDIQYDSAEIARVFFIPVQTLISIHKKKGYHTHKPDVYNLTYPYEDVVIWGVTAKMVYHLIEILLNTS